MHRIDHATREIDGNGPGKDGFTEGTPGVEAATVVTDDILNAFQEEIANVIEGRGIALSKPDNMQLRQAIVDPIENDAAYVTPKNRTVVLSAALFADGRPAALYLVTGTVGAWQPFDVDIGGVKTAKAANTDQSVKVLCLNRCIPRGAQITGIRVLVAPGAAHVMTADLNTYGLSFGVGSEAVLGASNVGGGSTDGTANLQSIDVGGLPVTMGATSLVLVVHSGDGDTSDDVLYGAEVDFIDLGPINV